MDISPAIWGLFLGLGDGAFYAIARDTYDVYISANRLNSKLTVVDIWKMLGIGAVLGICAPLGYLWAGSSVGELLDVHIYRCLVSIICAMLVSVYAFRDTVNGYQFAGALMMTIGFLFILYSTNYAS
jgi:hypothetical protein